MKRFSALTILLTLALSCTSVKDSMAKGQGHGNGNGQGQRHGDAASKINSMPKYELTEAQVKSLLYMWEEEKVARDVYLTFGKKYSTRIFSNIPRSEQKHMDAVKALITKYNIPLIGDDTIGKFETQEFQELYDSLVSKGQGTLKSALEVGREIEILDIKDLEDRLSDATPDMELVYNNLLRASYKHLSAFERNLARQ